MPTCKCPGVVVQVSSAGSQPHDPTHIRVHEPEDLLTFLHIVNEAGKAAQTQVALRQEFETMAAAAARQAVTIAKDVLRRDER